MTQIMQILSDKEYYIKWMLGRFQISYNQAEEYVSQLILKFLEKDHIPDIRSREYVRVSLRNMIIEDYRRKKGTSKRSRQDVIECYEDLFDFDKGCSEFQGISSYKDVRMVIYQMKSNYRRCLILKFGFGMKHIEIAEFLGLKRGTAAPLIMRAQRKLKQKIKEIV